MPHDSQNLPLRPLSRLCRRQVYAILHGEALVNWVPLEPRRDEKADQVGYHQRNDHCIVLGDLENQQHGCHRGAYDAREHRGPCLLMRRLPALPYRRATNDAPRCRWNLPASPQEKAMGQRCLPRSLRRSLWLPWKTRRPSSVHLAHNGPTEGASFQRTSQESRREKVSSRDCWCVSLQCLLNKLGPDRHNAGRLARACPAHTRTRPSQSIGLGKLQRRFPRKSLPSSSRSGGHTPRSRWETCR